MQHINLETFANGAFSAQINRAIEEVTKNIQDPNTDATVARKITVTIGFKPNQDRTLAPVGIQAKTTLAPALGAVTAIQMAKDLVTGEIQAAEIGNQIPGQMSIDDMNQGQRASTVQIIDGKAVDTTTGEILEPQNTGSKVVDLRKAREA